MYQQCIKNMLKDYVALTPEIISVYNIIHSLFMDNDTQCCQKLSVKVTSQDTVPAVHCSLQETDPHMQEMTWARQ